MSSEEPQKTGLEEKQHSNSILLLKKQGLKPKFKPFALGGCERTISFEQLKTHRNAIVSCKDQLKYAITRFGLS